MPHLSFNTPVGFLAVFEADDALVAIEWGRVPDSTKSPLLLRAQAQLEAYFEGGSHVFDLPLHPAGTSFQQRVWQYLRDIPYGATQTYGDVADALQTSPRAVGTACGRNPLPIVIPCHRVVGAGDRLVGYSGGHGVETKTALLSLENVPSFSNLDFPRDR